jgi:colanic acid/amylovoran biosynthesis glycosyltransferase
MKKSNKNCFLFTQSFPYGESEMFLKDELIYLSCFFESIMIFPLNSFTQKNLILPKNVYFIDVLNKSNSKKNSLNDYFIILKIILKEIKHEPIKIFKHLRFNVSLLNSELQKAKIFETYLKSNYDSNKTVYYSYWFDTWSLILSIVKFKSPELIDCYYSRAHGFDIFKEQTKNGYHPFKNFMLNQVKKVFSVSKAGKNYLQKNYKLNYNKIGHSYLGSEPNLFNDKPNNKQFIILTCANVRAIKRIDLIPDILNELPKSFFIKWILIGDGEGTNEIKEKCSKLSKNIEYVFKGNLSKENVIEFYKNNRIDLFLSVSRSEGLPYSMIEAISFGIPLMATNVGGCAEICNNNTGILIEKDFDVKNVAEKIITFSNSDMNSQPFRNGIRKFWEEYFNAEKNYYEFYKTISA